MNGQSHLAKRAGGRRAAIGICMHSGWGTVVSIAGGPEALEVVDRRRITVADGVNQPYHRAAQMPLGEAEKYLSESAAASEELALAAVQQLTQELKARRYRLAGAAILAAAGRSLPSLAEILAAHPLIHTAEGEFFRSAARRACERMSIPVIRVREKELKDCAKRILGKEATRVERKIAGLGKSLGAPWTADHKNAALAASLVLGRGKLDKKPGIAAKKKDL